MKKLKFSIGLVAVCLGLLVSTTANAQSRWSTTATDGSGLGLGDATTITWGFVADGTAISPAFGGESSDPSGLIGFLDTNIGAGAGGSDLTNRPWYTLFDDIFDRWDALSGLKFVYEPNDGGAAIDGSSTPQGSLGVYADVRIGGHSIDGQSGSNTLAYNYFPDHGDMVIDTDNVTFFSDSTNNYVGLRNVLAHEFGHGMGLPHVTANNSKQLMEAFVDLTFDGPQIDDIIEAQRRYGDNLEENGGNDAFGSATDLGVFSGADIELGTDADMGSSVIEVGPSESDFVSIDDDSDTDFLEITLTNTYDMSFKLDMVGPTYNHNGNSSYNLSRQSDLDIVILASDGSTVLGQSNNTGLDVLEQVDLQLTAGTYYAQITGRDNAAQFYRFTASGVLAGVPEPGSAAVLLLGATGLLIRRRRSA